MYLLSEGVGGGPMLRAPDDRVDGEPEPLLGTISGVIHVSPLGLCDLAGDK